MQYSDSLKKNNEFQRVYRKGTSQANRYLVMYVLENKDRHMENRLGISVSKKVGNSVVRHRITRLIRESYRLNETSFRQGVDIVVVARPSAKDRSYQEIESALMHLAGRTKVLRRTETVVEEKQAEQIRED
ncbi:MAG: ribonuclease P protein component [Blautia sp.]